VFLFIGDFAYSLFWGELLTKQFENFEFFFGDYFSKADRYFSMASFYGY